MTVERSTSFRRLILNFICLLLLLPTTARAREFSEQAVEKEYTFEVRITLGDGRTVLGNIVFRAPEKLLIRHVRDGIHYEKTVAPEDIGGLEFRQWKSSPLKRNKEGFVYRYDVDGYALTLRDETVLEQSGAVFDFWKQFDLQNKYGRVRMFSYWLDLQKDDGHWHTGFVGSAGEVRSRCHGDTVQKIEFLKHLTTAPLQDSDVRLSAGQPQFFP